MNQARRWLVWLSRIHRCRGFGIQSPTDYAFVRYVVNERWPYYAYDRLKAAGWLQQKMGRLYLRMANWRQPTVMQADQWQQWWQAGCLRTRFTDSMPERVEIARIDITDTELWEQLTGRTDEHSVVIIERLWLSWDTWHQIERDSRVGTTFDLYYCGIVLFDKQRYSHHYKINF